MCTANKRERGMRMSIDNCNIILVQEYKRLISTLIEKSMDIEYLMAVYSFASSYPDNTQKRDS